MLIRKAEERIAQYLKFLKKNRYRLISKLEFETFETDKTLRSPPQSAPWKKISVPYRYGKAWHCCWFKSSFKLPAKNAYPLFIYALPNSDSLLFIDEKPAGAFNRSHKKIKVNADGKNHILHIESYSGHYFPGCHPFDGDSVMIGVGNEIADFPNEFSGGAVVERIEPVYELFYDVKCLFELAKTLDVNSLRRAEIIRCLFDSLMEIHFSSKDDILVKEVLAVSKKTNGLLRAKNGPSVPEIHLIGHAHIDHAWLWHIGETERKTARTFMNMAKLAEEYPEFVFIQSQPAQLEGVKNNYPEIFNAVKEAYKKGNWEPNGGMWVEADCNIPSGESLIRQFLVGKQALKEMLNYEADTLWLPDVFGYAAALPQILCGCRIKYFVTSKISWNDTTRFPYDTFIWRGIDGSAVKTHFILNGYNGNVSPEFNNRVWRNVQHKEIQNAAINAAGEGDGGGGTARGDLETARRLLNLEGSPRASWRTVSEALDKIFGKEKEWPEWKGELYLELHRGTYTSQAKTKLNNRRNEFLLRRAEWLSAIAGIEGWAEYPAAKLLKNWKSLLTLQFHDIIPGSSINRVYAEAEAAHKEIANEISMICGEVQKKAGGDSGGGILLFNSLSWIRRGHVFFDANSLKGAAALKAEGGIAAAGSKRNDKASGIYPVQYYKNVDKKDIAVSFAKLPSLGWSLFSALNAKECSEIEGFNSDSPFVYEKNRSLRTPFYRVKFDGAGRISGLFDLKIKKELVERGGFFNAFFTAQDIPVMWEAWDIDSDWTKFLKPETRLLSSEAAADGPVCFIIRNKYAAGEKSFIYQDIVFYAREKRIDFVTKVEWNERQLLLKTAFNTAFDSSLVRCEVQYGHILRNTHRNLPQDRAKFEICAHKWISLEESDAGIALLNDCKYGHDVLNGSMRLTLLRSPAAPDPEADAGVHYFTYSLLPFSGSFASSNVIQKSYELNEAVEAEIKSGKPSKKAACEYSFLQIDDDSIIAESIKFPESGKKKTIIVRLYESSGGRKKTTLRFNRNIKEAFVTDMLEGNPKRIRHADAVLPLSFRAFEIKTIMVTLKDTSV